MAQSKSAKLARSILDHPDKDEVISKLCAGIPPKEVHEFLAARYSPETEKPLILSVRTITLFTEDYLDFYTQLQQDLVKTKTNLAPEQELTEVIQGTKSYHRALENLAEKELDLKSMLKKSLLNLESRISQIYDLIQEDPMNMRNDRSLTEYFNVLLSYIEKSDKIINGTPDQQININQFNIQVVDQHIDVVINIIREILMSIDYDAYNQFMERYSEEMGKLKSPNSTIVPIEQRLNAANHLIDKIETKLER